jgi:hypothetical protein
MALTENEALFDENGNGVLEPTEKQKMDQLAQYINVDAVNTTNNARSGTSSSTSRTKLTTNTARALMQMAAEASGFTGKFSSADIAQFIADFDKEQSRQIEKVVTSAAQKTTPGGTTEGAVDRTVETTAKTEYPSFFNPTQFAADWVWNKISFDDEKTLAAKNLSVLSQVRDIINRFNLMGVSDQEAKDAARLIAKGDKTLDEYTVELQQKAAIEYPQLADRFKLNPKLTTYEIASPVIKMLAKTWEVDEGSIGLDNPLVMSYLRPGGADGKGVAPSYYDLLLKAKNDPKYDLTREANENARDAASSLGRALGYGV